VSTGKSIAFGIGVGILSYGVVVLGFGLFGVKLGELDQFPAYVRCLANLEAAEAETDEPCRAQRSYFQRQNADPWLVERLAAESVAAADRLRATARNDADEIIEEWITPIRRRLEMAAEIIVDIFSP
jgi:hypothetical protein